MTGARTPPSDDWPRNRRAVLGEMPASAAKPAPPRRHAPGRSHLEIFGGLADIAVAGQARAAAVFSPPPFRREVGRGVPPLGAPASPRPRAKRERGCGPSARQAGGTPALPGNSRMSGIGKLPDRAAQPRGQPPSRPPPFQGGGEKTARPASLFGHREHSRTAPLTPPPFPGGGVKTESQLRLPWTRPQGNRTWKFRGGSPTSPSPGRRARGRRLLSSPLQGGGREGGPAPGRAGVPQASREARTRMRASGPPGRRDAGAPRQLTDERDREGPRPGHPAPGLSDRIDR